jgi:PRC-barrel domain protein
MAEPKAAAGAPPPLKEALGWIGFRVDDLNGSRVGTVQSVYVDAADEEPVWLAVKVGRFGRVTVLPYTECADGPGRIWVAQERRTIRAAPAIESGEPLVREQEIELCAHYLIRSSGRHADVEERAAKAITSRPADV